MRCQWSSALSVEAPVLRSADYREGAQGPCGDERSIKTFAVAPTLLGSAAILIVVSPLLPGLAKIVIALMLVTLVATALRIWGVPGLLSAPCGQAAPGR